MADYNYDDYANDLEDPEVPHIKSRARFKNFYHWLGLGEVQKSQTSIQATIDHVKPKGKILELGCHWGFNCIHWAKKGFHCTGIDLSDTLIKYGEERLEEQPQKVQDNVKLVCCFIEDFIPSGQYDTVVLTEVLEHVIDPIPVLKKAAECMHKDSLLYITAPSGKWGNNSHVRGVSKEDLMNWVTQSGLAIVELRGFIYKYSITYAIAKKI